MAKRLKALEDEIEALKARDKRRDRGEESHNDPEEEEGEGEGRTPQANPQEEEMAPKERRLLNALKSMKGYTFDLKMDVEEVIEWVDYLNNYFEYTEVLEEKKVKFEKTKYKGDTLTRWNYTQGERVKKNKSMINSWDKIVNKMKS